MFESDQSCVVTEHPDGHLDVTFLNPAALSPELIPETSRRLHSVVRMSSADVLLNLSRINFVSSAALNLLLKLRHICEEKGTRFALTGLSPQVRDVFHVTQLERLFDIQSGCESCGA